MASVGIDFGTASIAASVAVDDGRVVSVVPKNGAGRESAVYASMPGGAIAVGPVAEEQMSSRAQACAHALKRIIGRAYNDAEVKAATRMMGCAIRRGIGTIELRMTDADRTPQQLTALSFARIRRAVEKALAGESLSCVSVAIPAMFGQAQRQAVIDAAIEGGFENVRLVSNTVAAVLHVTTAEGAPIGPTKYAVIDWGAGSLDVSIVSTLLDATSGGRPTIEVLHHTGDTCLGGEDFDWRVSEHLVRQIHKLYHTDIRGNKSTLMSIKDAARIARIALSSDAQSRISMGLPNQDGTRMHLDYTLTKRTLESLTADMVRHALKIIRQALIDTGLTQDDIDRVVLCGGMTEMPLVRESFAAFFHKVADVVGGDDIACGAALSGGHTAPEILDITPLNLGVAMHNGSFRTVIPRGTRIPCHSSIPLAPNRRSQDVVKIIPMQGDSDTLTDNVRLAEFVICRDENQDMAADMPKNILERTPMNKIDVRLSVDTNNIASVRIIPPHGLPVVQKVIQNDDTTSRLDISIDLDEL